MPAASFHIPPGVVTYLAQSAPYLSIVALLLTLIALIFILLLSRRLERVTLGQGGTLEETLKRLGEDLEELQQFRGELEIYLKTAEARLHSALRGLGVVRFNPFNGTGQGGNQSFAIALLDEKHSGVVFSALYARDRVGVYAKPIVEGKPAYELTEEEKEAVEKARAHLGQKR